MKKSVKITIIAVVGVIVILFGIFFGVYDTRIASIKSLTKITDYPDSNLYRMDIKYNYNNQHLIDYGIKDTESFIQAAVKECMPFVKLKINVQKPGCSAFMMKTADNKVLMGRSYDYIFDTPAILVSTAPKNGYKSIGLCAFSFLSKQVPDENFKTKFATLVAPYMCLDGMNEKGVSIAVLFLDSDSTNQQTEKQAISTSLFIRLVLDNAATTEEAVQIAEKYDMVSVFGDYHFYVTDASGDGRIIEWDCESPDRTLMVTSTPAITNFYLPYIDKVLPYQKKNGIYGHGKERYDKIMAVMDKYGPVFTEEHAWIALKDASQLPNPDEVTSNTMWSIVYNDSDLEANFTLKRKWGDVWHFKMNPDAKKVQDLVTITKE